MSLDARTRIPPLRLEDDDIGKDVRGSDRDDDWSFTLKCRIHLNTQHNLFVDVKAFCFDQLRLRNIVVESKRVRDPGVIQKCVGVRWRSERFAWCPHLVVAYGNVPIVETT